MSARVRVVALAAMVMLTSCDRGDWFPFERTIREVLLAWDMWDTQAVRPYEEPMPGVPEGVVSTEGHEGYEEASQALSKMDEKKRAQRAAVTYRRYCHHCHGSSGDGRIIVGESFSPAVPDLRTKKVRDMTDEQIYDQVFQGTKVMIPLGTTLTPEEILLAIHHVRSLANAPSHPYFSPKSTEPVE